MIAALLLSTALAASPEPPAPAPGTPHTTSLDEKITLELKDASVKDVLEKIAVLLDATPIFDPGIEGTLTVSMNEQPIGKILRYIEKSTGLSATLQVRRSGEEGKPEQVQRRLVVTRPGAPQPPAEDALALDRELLSDRSLPRRPRTNKPFEDAGEHGGDLFEFRSGAGAASLWRVPPGVRRLELPGCAAPVRVAVISVGGATRLVFPAAGSQPRIERFGAEGTTSGHRLALAGCRESFAITERKSAAGAETRDAAMDAMIGRDQWMITAKLIEVTTGAEKVLVAPKIMAMTGGLVSVQSAQETGASAGKVLVDAQVQAGSGEMFPVRTVEETSAGSAHERLHQFFSVYGVVVDRTDRDALLALSVVIDRQVEPAPGEPVVVIRRAESDQSLRMTFGQTERVTISPTWGRGGSALVLELSIAPMEPKKH